jgi:hypothetical protein
MSAIGRAKAFGALLDPLRVGLSAGLLEVGSL